MLGKCEESVRFRLFIFLKGEREREKKAEFPSGNNPPKHTQSAPSSNQRANCNPVSRTSAAIIHSGGEEMKGLKGEGWKNNGQEWMQNQDEERRVMGQVISHPAEREGSPEKEREGSD